MKFKTNIFIAFTIMAALYSCKEHKPLKIDLESRILDSAKVLSSIQKGDLFTLIESIDNELGPQVAIITIDTLTSDIEQFSNQSINKLALGRESINDGLLIVVAMRNRKSRIEVGHGLEKVISNQLAKQILEEELKPQFQQLKFYEGLKLSISRLKDVMKTNRHLIGIPMEPR